MNEEHSVIHEPYFSNCLITNLKNSHLPWVARSREQLQQSSEVRPGLQALPKRLCWLKKNSAYFPLNFTGCWTGFEDFAGIRHSESIPTGSACNFGGKGKGGEILEVHWLNKKSLQDHLMLWPKLMAKLEYVIPLLQLPGTPAHAPIRSGRGEGKQRISSKYVCTKLPSLLTNKAAKDVPQQGDLSPGPPRLPGGAWARNPGSRSQDTLFFSSSHCVGCLQRPIRTPNM